MPARTLLLLLFTILSHLSLTLSHSHEHDEYEHPLGKIDPAGVGRHLPFHLPFHARETRISSEVHPGSSLMHSKQFDTSYMHRSILAALEREEDTREFAKWLDQAATHSKAFVEKMEKHQFWTIFAPSNSAVKSFLASFPESSSSDAHHSHHIRILERHFIPDQSFVIFSDLPKKRIELKSMAKWHMIDVCEMERRKDCKPEKGDKEDAKKDKLTHLPLLHSSVLVKNRMTGNGIVHVIDHVLVGEDEWKDIEDGKKEHEPLESADAAELADLTAWSHSSGSSSSDSSSAPSSQSHGPPRSRDHPPCVHCRHIEPKKVHATPPPGKIHQDARDQLKEGVNQTETESDSRSGDREDGNHHNGDHSYEHDTSSHHSYDSSYNDGHHSIFSSLVESLPKLQDDVPIVHPPSANPDPKKLDDTAAVEMELMETKSKSNSTTHVEHHHLRHHHITPVHPSPAIPSDERINSHTVPEPDDYRGSEHQELDHRTPPKPISNTPPPNEPDTKGKHPSHHHSHTAVQTHLTSSDEPHSGLAKSTVSGNAHSADHPIFFASSDDNSAATFANISFGTWLLISVTGLILFILCPLIIFQRCAPDRWIRLKYRLVACWCCGESEDTLDFEAVAATTDLDGSTKPLIDDRTYQAAARGRAPPDL